MGALERRVHEDYVLLAFLSHGFCQTMKSSSFSYFDLNYISQYSYWKIRLQPFSKQQISYEKKNALKILGINMGITIWSISLLTGRIVCPFLFIIIILKSTRRISFFLIG